MAKLVYSVIESLDGYAADKAGGGTRSLLDGSRLDLKLMDEGRFDNGMMYVNYRSAT